MHGVKECLKACKPGGGTRRYVDLPRSLVQTGLLRSVPPILTPFALLVVPDSECLLAVSIPMSPIHHPELDNPSSWLLYPACGRQMQLPSTTYRKNNDVHLCT